MLDKLLSTIKLKRKCLFDHYHWRWQRLCDHGFGKPAMDEGSSWHGGVLDLKTGIELAPCAHCSPEYAAQSLQFVLSDEETHILAAWRLYRTHFLDAFEESSYRYVLSVDLNGTRQNIMERAVGIAVLTQNRDMVKKTKTEGKMN